MMEIALDGPAAQRQVGLPPDFIEAHPDRGATRQKGLAMASHVHLAIVRAFGDAFNRRDFDEAVALTAPDVELLSVATGERLVGPEGVRRFLRAWATAFPDSRVDLTTVVADDRAAAVELVSRGTHAGPLRGPAGMLAPTNRYVELRLAQFFELRDGSIVGARLYFDVASLLRQLGVAPYPVASRATSPPVRPAVPRRGRHAAGNHGRAGL